MPYLHIMMYYQRLAMLDDYWFWRAHHYECASLNLIHHYELDGWL